MDAADREDVALETSGGMLRKFTSKKTSEMFWTMNDIPTAVISTASRGALRRRR